MSPIMQRRAIVTHTYVSSGPSLFAGTPVLLVPLVTPIKRPGFELPSHSPMPTRHYDSPWLQENVMVSPPMDGLNPLTRVISVERNPRDYGRDHAKTPTHTITFEITDDKGSQSNVTRQAFVYANANGQSIYWLVGEGRVSQTDNPVPKL